MTVAGVWTGVGFSNLKNSWSRIQKFWNWSGVGVWKSDSGHLWLELVFFSTSALWHPCCLVPLLFGTSVIWRRWRRTHVGYNCCDRKSRAAYAQSFALWQQATIEFTCHDHSLGTLVIMFNRSHVNIGRASTPRTLFYCLFAPHVCMVLFFTHIPFVVNHTINATPPERLQHNDVDKTWEFIDFC